MAEITPVDILADVKKVYTAAGRISKRFYLRHGSYSERQVRNHFGTFNNAFAEAGLITEQPKPKVDTPHDAGLPEGAKFGQETNEFTDDTWKAVRKSAKQITSLEELLTFFKVDEEVWDVERWKCNTWAMAGFPKTVGSSKNWHRDSTEPIVTPIYQVSATFIKKKLNVFVRSDLEDIKQRFIDELSGIKPVTNPFVYRETRLASGNMLELNVPDLHAGKLAWSKETGYKNYDTEIALDTFETAVCAILERSSHIAFDRILFVVGNDLMHSDTIGGTTYKGTHLDVDSRYHKVFIKIRERLVKIIRERLLPIAPVTVVGCPGNHDKTAAWHIVDSLQQRFFDNTNIEFLNDPTEYKFFRWGQVMLMFAHGDTGKKTDYPLTMAQERKQMWADSTYREAHTGHIHQTMVQEIRGVRVRTLPALCEPDAWHAANNFTGNILAAESYCWNKTTGLTDMFFYNVP